MGIFLYLNIAAACANTEQRRWPDASGRGRTRPILHTARIGELYGVGYTGSAV